MRTSELNMALSSHNRVRVMGCSLNYSLKKEKKVDSCCGGSGGSKSSSSNNKKKETLS